MVDRKLSGEIELLGENPIQFHFVHHIWHMTWNEIEFGIEPRPTRWANRLSYVNSRLIPRLGQIHFLPNIFKFIIQSTFRLGYVFMLVLDYEY
jgi:hypothetical protein